MSSEEICVSECLETLGGGVLFMAHFCSKQARTRDLRSLLGSSRRGRGRRGRRRRKSGRSGRRNTRCTGCAEMPFSAWTAPSSAWAGTVWPECNNSCVQLHTIGLGEFCAHEVASPAALALWASTLAWCVQCRQAGFGWLWLALAGFGRLWLALAGFGWLWLALAGWLTG